MGDTVVMALDDSPYAENAFNWYFAHMHKPDNVMVFVHAMDVPAMPTRESFDKHDNESRAKGKALCDKFVPKLQEHGIESPEFVIDFHKKPGEMIIEVAEKKDATVVVMGTRGMGKLARAFLGSVSNYVLNHSPCPVLVVRLKKEEH